MSEQPVTPPNLPLPSLMTEMRTGDIPEVYRRFDEIIGARHWHKRVLQIKKAIKGNHFLGEFLHAENEIAFGLVRCGEMLSRYGRLPDDVEATRPLYAAITFAAQVLSMIDLFGEVEGDRFRRRATDAIKNPDNMQGLRLEMTAATHFTRRGNKLRWPEMTGEGTFDLLVTDLGPSGLEVECKSISEDKGRTVHAEEALSFTGLLMPELSTIRASLRVGLAVVLTLPAQLPSAHAARAELAKTIRKQIIIGASARLDDGTDIRIEEFDLSRIEGLDPKRDPASVRAAIQAVTRTDNRHGLLFTSPGGGALAFAIQSMADDNALEATFDTLARAAKDQLKASRPGLLIAGFHGLSSEQLLSVANQDADPSQRSTALAVKVSQFLSADTRDHVIGAAFISRSALAPRLHGTFENAGASYYFPKRDTTFWHDDFTGLFGSAAAATGSL